MKIISIYLPSFVRNISFWQQLRIVFTIFFLLLVLSIDGLNSEFPFYLSILLLLLILQKKFVARSIEFKTDRVNVLNSPSTFCYRYTPSNHRDSHGLLYGHCSRWILCDRLFTMERSLHHVE